MAGDNNVVRIQRELVVVQTNIKNLLQQYKNPNLDQMKKLDIVEKLKQENIKKKKLDAQLDDLVSTLHQGVELDVDAAEDN